MSDLWSWDVPKSWINSILEHISCFPDVTFFFETKNPSRYFQFIDRIPENSILSVTLETNNIEGKKPFSWVYKQYSDAPLPNQRFFSFFNLDWKQKHVSIEPIFDFDLTSFVTWMTALHPKSTTISIGYDNYRNRLPEPSLDKTLELINELEKSRFKVERKTLRKAWWEKE